MFGGPAHASALASPNTTAVSPSTMGVQNSYNPIAWGFKTASTPDHEFSTQRFSTPVFKTSSTPQHRCSKNRFNPTAWVLTSGKSRKGRISASG